MASSKPRRAAREEVAVSGWKPRGGEFGGGRENAGHDHGHDQVTLRARRTGENGLQAESAQSAENGGDMAVGSGALNAESVGRERPWHRL
jgi:hypothetical protein